VERLICDVKSAMNEVVRSACNKLRKEWDHKIKENLITFGVNTEEPLSKKQKQGEFTSD